MTYARARLWLGIVGVGTIVVISAFMVIGRVPQKLLPDSEHWRFVDVGALLGFVVGYALLVLPLDVLGGYVLPCRFGRSTISFRTFACQWSVGVAIQSILFVLTGLAILAGGRVAGLPAALFVIAAVGVAYVVFQRPLASVVMGRSWQPPTNLPEDVERLLATRGLRRDKLVVVDHSDPGFTGGVVGWPGQDTILIPRKWLEVLSAPQLALAIARRFAAVSSSSRTRGLVLSLAWILSGFAIVSFVPGGGVVTVAQLVTTSCSFVGWIFAGLLILPTVSRRASYIIDRRVVEAGYDQNLLHSTLKQLDELQDDEPERNSCVETIFHPVPSVYNRRQTRRNSALTLDAWHVARMILFLSWCSLGLLARVVHCNLGRPDLWVLLPTD